MNIDEIEIILTEGYNHQCDMLIRHADLKAATLNAPHFHKSSGAAYTPFEFLPKDIIAKVKKEMKKTKNSAADQAQIILKKGEALANSQKRLIAQRKGKRDK